LLGRYFYAGHRMIITPAYTLKELLKTVESTSSVLPQMINGKDGENLIGCQFLQKFGPPYNDEYKGKVIAHLSCTNQLPDCRKVV
jgi:hypothetical protein